MFEDRQDAGRKLAGMLSRIGLKYALVFAIPSGGVPVAFEIAKNLKIPMKLIVVRKLQIPFNPEAGFGAVDPDGELVLNTTIVRQIGLTGERIEKIKEVVVSVIKNRMTKFNVTEIESLNGKEVVLVDDGLASGYTMLAAVRYLKKRGPKRITVAVPTAHVNSMRLIEKEVDEVVAAEVSSEFVFAVANAYQKWWDLSDEEVMSYLKRSA